MTKIGIVQMQAHDNDERAIAVAARMLRRLGRSETDIVCLPEQWLNENRIDDFDARFYEFKKIAREYSMTVIAGAFYHKKERSLVISAPIIGPSGDIIGEQDKIHPFDYERNKIRAGTKIKVFKSGCRFGVLICYDMVFSDVAEMLGKKGAQVLLSPSRIVRRGIIPWHMYVQVRSLENRMPILAANIESWKYGGKSIIADMTEKNGVMIPSRTLLTGQSAKHAEFDLKKYEKPRRSRYSDHHKFV
ncbi:MAG: carbon-nitrogen hydrolase family protein [Candidatus Nitrosotenuis sp.]|nr:carbon-nitrogen hydrolase family protein [Candidatus Nitrosotenuis sp.]